jgi:hypothetical protein
MACHCTCYHSLLKQAFALGPSYLHISFTASISYSLLRLYFICVNYTNKQRCLKINIANTEFRDGAVVQTANQTIKFLHQ